MDPFHFACPHCSSRLRLREKLLVGRQIDCPECGQSLLVVAQQGQLGVQRIERKAAHPAVEGKATDAMSQGAKIKGMPSGQPASVGDSATTGGKTSKPAAASASGGSIPIRSTLPGANPGTEPAAPATDAPQPVPKSRRKSLLIVGGTLCLTLAVIALALSARSNRTNEGVVGAPQDKAVEPLGDPAENVAGNAPPEGAGQPQVAPLRDEVDVRLTKIGRLLLDYVADDAAAGGGSPAGGSPDGGLPGKGAFPAGTVPILGIAPDTRLSWMAVLADRFDDGGPDPIWDRPWNSPQNEPFVRRRLKNFQNPAIPQLTGGDGYPASHYVGVAGVGADAARLDNRHPRAGIFGDERRTRIDDIRDGASNTLLVLGVREHLGSWAAGGQPTMRGLSREPYINGPDGFGTGSPDSMQALLADGRVIVVNDQIDPRILRRMAAKADGLALDESAAGEPGDRPSLLADKGAPASTDVDDEESRPVESPANKRPLDPQFAPEPALPPAKKIDLAVSLKQPIVRFDQPKSRPLSEVLTGVAEMAGTQIDFDRDELGSAAARLAEPVALKLDNTTVGDILTGLLRPAGLAYRVEGDHLKLVLREKE